MFTSLYSQCNNNYYHWAMSFSVVNMCRFVIAVTFISFISCVLSSIAPSDKKNETKCQNLPEAKASRTNMVNCFNKIVEQNLVNNNITTPGECKNADDFSEKLNSYFSTVNKVCNKSSQYNTTDMMNFIEFSLSNGSFKELYKDGCVKTFEKNISRCVQVHVGSFNITKEKKHMTWRQRVNLQYSEATCTKSENVKNCVEVVLSPCQPATRQYVASLFEFARKDCANITTTFKHPVNNGTTTATAPWMTTPVAITISVGALVVVTAIIILIIFNVKKSRVA